MRYIAEGHEKIWPYPQRAKENGIFVSPGCVRVIGPTRTDFIDDLKKIGKLRVEDAEAAYTITLGIGFVRGSQSYELEIRHDGAYINGEDDAGLFYGMQTFIQAILAYGRNNWPLISITDWPDYQHRSFMVDMGRSIYSLPYLKRIVRILARLRMNQLHIHLYDDELCGIRFDGLPFGKENPYSISIADLGELVNYARNYHVQIVPELEAWGHVGSIVYHDKSLRGGSGMFGGSSFLIGQKTFDIVRNMIKQIVTVMPSNSVIHLGLDEAEWFKESSVAADYTPKDMVGRYYEILSDIAGGQNKNIEMLLWADHGGREIPQNIKNKLIVEPWTYWCSQYEKIDKDVKKYSAADNPRWMIGAGQSMAHYRGAHKATRYWCRQAKNSPNVYGVNITFWGWNDIDNKFSTLFFGAYHAWNACPATFFAEIEETEDYERIVYPLMFWWQSIFTEANPDKISADRGPLVLKGYYLWGDQHGKPVAPTVIAADTAQGHDYLNEYKDDNESK